MPELPEVETVCRGLREARLATAVTHCWRSDCALRVGRDWQREHENTGALVGRVPGEITRRGKYILWAFSAEHSSQTQVLTFVIHLGMSGRCGVVSATAPVVAHTHLRLTFADQRELRFVDPRRFGGLRVGPSRGLMESWSPIAKLGMEPLDSSFSGRILRDGYGQSKRCVRDALLDQRKVAGIGNIYAVEACFHAGVHPLREASSLQLKEWNKIAKALVHVLKLGIANGGTTLSHFRDVTGDVGRNQDDLNVYGRAGEPCPKCSSAMTGFQHGGRSGVYCAQCQV